MIILNQKSPVAVVIGLSSAVSSVVWSLHCMASVVSLAPLCTWPWFLRSTISHGLGKVGSYDFVLYIAAVSLKFVCGSVFLVPGHGRWMRS